LAEGQAARAASVYAATARGKSSTSEHQFKSRILELKNTSIFK